MTITNVKRLAGTGKAKYAGGKEYRIPFQVFFSNGYSEAALVINSDSRLPKLSWYLGQESGATASDTAVFCTDIDITLDPASPYATDANGVANYIATFTQPQANFNANPLLRIDVRWSGTDITRNYSYDKTGTRLENSANQLYQGVPDQPIDGASVVITTRQVANPGTIVQTYSNTVCSTALWGWAAKQSRMGKIEARPVIENSLFFWELSFPIDFIGGTNPEDNWRVFMLDQGWTFTNDDGDPQIATDNVGQKAVEPVALDGSGGILDGGDPDFYPADGFVMHKEISWAPLNLPNPYTFVGSM